MKLGITVFPVTFIILASFGTLTSPAGPTSLILDPEIIMILFAIGGFPVPSMRVPPLITILRSDISIPTTLEKLIPFNFKRLEDVFITQCIKFGDKRTHVFDSNAQTIE